jgi:uncharacterized protein
MSKTAIVQKAYQCFGEGNVPGILELLTDNVVWISPHHAPVKPIGTFEGKDNVVQFFMQIGGTTEFQVFEPRLFVENENVVAVQGYSKGVVKSTGKSFEGEWVMWWTFEGDKVSRFQAFEDTYTAYVAFS